jgi:hypothetical protein
MEQARRRSSQENASSPRIRSGEPKSEIVADILAAKAAGPANA